MKKMIVDWHLLSNSIWTKKIIEAENNMIFQNILSTQGLRAVTNISGEWAGWYWDQGWTLIPPQPALLPKLPPKHHPPPPANPSQPKVEQGAVL